jgi:hypothetical protein
MVAGIAGGPGSWLWRAPSHAQHQQRTNGRIFASANPTRPRPQLFFWIPRIVIRHFCFGIRMDASIRYLFVFHLDTHLALTCLSTQLYVIGG